MKKAVKAVLVLVASVMSLSSFGQTKKTFEVKNGMNQMVPFEFTIYDNTGEYTLEQALNKHRERESQKGMTGIPNNDKLLYYSVSKVSLMTKLMVVKNQATWIPSKLVLLWSKDDKRYFGQLEGFAQNGYGVVGEVKVWVFMDEFGQLQRI
jgi:hypothetical protein